MFEEQKLEIPLNSKGIEIRLADLQIIVPSFRKKNQFVPFQSFKKTFC